MKLRSWQDERLLNNKKSDKQVLELMKCVFDRATAVFPVDIAAASDKFLRYSLGNKYYRAYCTVWVF
jgi:hypothetical protein